VANHRLKYGMKKLVKVGIWVAVLYSLMIPLLYFMYKNNRGFDWWSILDGNPAVPPEYRTYVIQNNLPFAPDFDIWKVTKALPFALLGPLFMMLFYMIIVVMQFVAIFWFMARGRTYTLYPGEYDVGFDDVRGQPEIVASTKEALTLFQGFKKFREAGGYPPHGILFEGPPGTGKTLLGKAIAGSAKVPFLYASGSSFNNMFMGVGNLRIARLFKKARKMSHKYGGAVIFIDELDAVGGSRGAVSATREGGLGPLEPPKIIMGGLGAGGASMYVNELLIQMDGITMARGLGRHVRRLLRQKPKVPQYNLMVIGATNQASTLDPALLRAGRFDRKLHVGLPSGPGREDILTYYLDKVPHEPVDTGRLSRATQGFSPAQIKNLVNEALIFALMDGRDQLNFNDLWDAKVTEELGLKEPDYSSAREKQMTAFHEAGHAVVGYVLRLDEQIQVASIIKRGRALGVVYSTPVEESQSKLREDIQRDISMFMGGLAAEEIWFGQTTTGPSADLRNATRLAIQMLGLFGMGDDDYLSYGVVQETYKGGTIEWVLDDPERRRAVGTLLGDCKREAVEILRRNEPAMRALAERLLEKGEVLGEEVEEIMKAKGVARSTPTFRPVLELTEADWHPPALIDASQREVGNGAPPERPPTEPPGRTGPAVREADEGFEW
jgi:cell division protease FtsH